MTYNLRKRPIILKSNEELNMFYYRGPADYKKFYETLDTVDKQNVDWLKTFYGVDVILDTYDTTDKVTNNKLTVLKEKKVDIENLYNDIIDLLFKWLNKTIYETPPDGGLKGAVKLPGLLESKCSKVFPLARHMVEIANVIMKLKYPEAPTELAISQELTSVENNIQNLKEQMKVAKPSKPEKKQKQ